MTFVVPLATVVVSVPLDTLLSLIFCASLNTSYDTADQELGEYVKTDRIVAPNNKDLSPIFFISTSGIQ